MKRMEAVSGREGGVGGETFVHKQDAGGEGGGIRLCACFALLRVAPGWLAGWLAVLRIG